MTKPHETDDLLNSSAVYFRFTKQRESYTSEIFEYSTLFCTLTPTMVHCTS